MKELYFNLLLLVLFLLCVSVGNLVVLSVSGSLSLWKVFCLCTVCSSILISFSNSFVRMGFLAELKSGLIYLLLSSFLVSALFFSFTIFSSFWEKLILFWRKLMFGKPSERALKNNRSLPELPISFLSEPFPISYSLLISLCLLLWFCQLWKSRMENSLEGVLSFRWWLVLKVRSLALISLIKKGLLLLMYCSKGLPMGL